jgi:protein-L-isoaspartate(D-aspartate) O-methyltransferase
MTDPKLQRANMVESQNRPSDVTDRRILRAMREVPREAFVPAALKTLAYSDEALPVDPGRFRLAPRTFAKIVQLAGMGGDAIVLDVGAASGYSTAVLARIASSVVAVEEDQVLAERASHTLKEIGVTNVKIMIGPLAEGAASEGPYDASLCNGAVAQAPLGLLDQLKDGGVLVCIVADGPVGKAMLWRRFRQTYDARAAFDAGAPTLPGFERTREFAL